MEWDMPAARLRAEDMHRKHHHGPCWDVAW